ncbi:GntR family transcriptional regulator [Kibdelosporangium banguiense]|uniref:GntR family transcriptional regulator n=1 Tax=Kibdelosporangium banguiense TaxID=1365924 RepID=UPI001FD95B09|nr:GntR family transcriptional regulator [Kibdelosporangium banguiense]
MWRVIARHIRNDIEAGVLRHGQPLPSTRALAAEWDVSVDPVAKAMAELAAEGLVVTRDRSSRIVNYPDAELAPAALPTTPKVLLIGGYAGSGKTELGRILARRTHWPILDKDTTTRPVVEAALEKLGVPPSDRESDIYLTLIRPAEYEALIAAMTENVSCGNSAIVTAPFIRELSDRAWCDRISASVESMGATLHVVWVRCDADTMRAYIRHRGAARDSAKLANWEDYLAGIDLDFKPAIDHMVVENSAGARPLQQQAEELLRQVGR